jgi:hypothetical protein
MYSILKHAALPGCLIFAMALLAPSSIQGNEWNLATRFSVSHQFQVPGVILQADTPYVIRLVDSPGTRNVVQIYNEDQTDMLTMFMAVSTDRAQATDDTVFTFMETGPGYAVPVKEWFYPGRLTGLEFLYPKDQAAEIASHSREAVLTADAGVIDRAIATPRSEDPVEQPAEVAKPEEPVSEGRPDLAEVPSPAPEAEQAANQEAQESIGQIAQADVSEADAQQEPVEGPALDESDEELPRTAGELPLIALIGILCIGASLGLKVRAPKRG